jgi:type II secretory pathway pseudopilin PulG
MRLNQNESEKLSWPAGQGRAGFTLIEVLVGGAIMIILCVGILTVFSYVVKINRGENLRMQALSVLQRKVEYYRSLKFVPVNSSAELNGRTETNVGTMTSEDGRVFNILVTIDNDPATAGVQVGNDGTTKFKEITITAVPATAETGWLANLRTNVTIQRVRAN